MFEDGVVERLVADFFADLDHAWDLVSFAFANQVCDGGGENENFQGSDAAFFVDPSEKILGNDTFESFGEGRADFVLLLGREDVDDTVDGFSGAGSMQGAENQMASAGGNEGEFNGFEVTQLTDKHDVR